MRGELPRSQTDQYDERHFKVLQSMGLPLCPVTAFSRWSAIRSPDSQEDDPVSNRPIRAKLDRALRCDAVFRNSERAKVGTHSLRACGASLMVAVGFELEVIKRWGRWISTTFRNYLWRDEHVLSHIGRRMVESDPVSGHRARRASGRVGGKRSRPTEYEFHRRPVGISETRSGAVRNRRMGEMGAEGWEPVNNVCKLSRMRGLNTTMGDIRLIVNGEGGNNKLRFELSRWGRCVRCAQGHSSGSGVRPNVLPVATDLKYIIHGASLAAARCIAREGMRKGDRLHVHFTNVMAMDMFRAGKPSEVDQKSP